MLFDPTRHEPLESTPWDEARVRDAIRVIVEDLENALASGTTWPWHPLDEENPAQPRHKSLYLGSAGGLWAMGYLEQQGAAALRIRPAEMIDRVYAEYLEEPDTGEVVPSLFLGEVGILLVMWRLTQSPLAAERLARAIEANIANPTNEALWGAPGTMLGALHMLEWTGDRKWAELFLANAEPLWGEWHRFQDRGFRIWTQDLYGKVTHYLGAGHGFAGNAYALLRGATLLAPERREALYDRCVETVSRCARVEGDAANWPPTMTARGPGDPKMLLQWCHGAPGFVTALSPFPPLRSAVLDELLVQGGNATWQAGPLAKGSGLCHGTAGNGYAFLKLHQRTGDAKWLERARAFAMHAIAQAEKMRDRYGHGRYSLWTGDPGLAIYLWHCVTGDAALPSLDTFG